MTSTAAIRTGMTRARSLAQTAMNAAPVAPGDTESDYAKSQRLYAQRVQENREQGILRGLRHNQGLRVAAQIRRHGGFQMDLFADNDTGQLHAA